MGEHNRDTAPALVIGGSGFVGGALVEQLLAAGRPVRVLDLIAHPDPRVESIVGDLRRMPDVLRACSGASTVFLCAAAVDWGWGRTRLLREVNVEGPRNVVAACREAGVPRLIFTSSIDVVFEGKPIRAGDERLPYPRKHLDVYGDTKTMGEQLVLAANGGGLATCALRLGGVYGPNDSHRLPALVRVGRRGPIPRLGSGEARFSHVYVENAANAHVMAERHLTADGALGGQAYFIVDPQPGNFFLFLRPIVEALGLRMAERPIPYRLIYLLALASEAWHRVRRAKQPPSLTRYTVTSTCLDFWFTGEKAASDFGYRPLVGNDEAQRRTIAWARQAFGEG
ncbi:MAG TPA: NAD-dependent epimerase/dehydratase family protein [Herpetosiphonaceae bacterium]|nr:NAD-dependent epimerase/dehydratase family protein [Herpetosiphonaceae bacterium]